MPTLPHILEEIDNMLDVPDDQLTDEQKTAMDAYLDELAGQEKDKIDGFGQWVKFQTARIESIKEEGKRLTAKAKTEANKLERLQNFYLSLMQQRGLKKIVGDVYTVSVSSSEKTIVNVPVEQLDEMFVRVKINREPDLNLIKENIKNGIEVPGCEVIKNYSLRVK